MDSVCFRSFGVELFEIAQYSPYTSLICATKMVDACLETSDVHRIAAGKKPEKIRQTEIRGDAMRCESLPITERECFCWRHCLSLQALRMLANIFKCARPIQIILFRIHLVSVNYKVCYLSCPK